MDLRYLPAIDRLLESPELAPWIARHGRGAVKAALQRMQNGLRQSGEVAAWAGEASGYAARLETRLADAGYRPVHNMTGTLIHTNLGRAPLGDALWQSVRPLLRGAMNLEYNLGRGKRGDRDQAVAARLMRLSGGEAATVVNNNAAALLLVLNTLALDQDVAVSRGELIEIGGSFRLPELMRRANCRLLEVGTTNRTHLRDYAAVAAQTALLLKVHPSNYSVSGFTESVGVGALGKLARTEGLPLCVDLGSGALKDLGRFGLPHEPTLRQTLDAGADLVTCSGDKLLGGVQAGLIVGRHDLIEQLNANPLKRALRPDRVTLALLDAVLKLHEDAEGLPEALPLMRLLLASPDHLQQQAERLLDHLQPLLPGYSLEVRASQAQVGSGALPDQALESRALVIRHAQAAAVRDLEQQLRRLDEPVIGRIHKKALWLDLRSLADFEDALLALARGFEEDSLPLAGMEHRKSR